MGLEGTSNFCCFDFFAFLSFLVFLLFPPLACDGIRTRPRVVNSPFQSARITQE